MDELSDAYTKAHTRELNSRADMYDAVTGLLTAWSGLITSLKPAIEKIGEEVLAEIASRVKQG